MAHLEDAQLRAEGDPVVGESSTAVPAAGPLSVVPAAEPLCVIAAVEVQVVIPAAEDADVPPPGGCRIERRGWAGAHLHGAVRPRRRAVGRARPPGRWC